MICDKVLNCFPHTALMATRALEADRNGERERKREGDRNSKRARWTQSDGETLRGRNRGRQTAGQREK